MKNRDGTPNAKTRKLKRNAQMNLFEEIIVDNFAGGGGASTGMELATGRPVAIAINHDPDAIRLHKTNHPYTLHLQASVWDVNPVEVVGGRPVGLAWFSPDCKHFSKAKGAALVDRNIRGLAWIVLRWAGTVRPRVILLENVEEFVTWGPVRKGKPVKSKAGQTFQKWKRQLLDLGYAVEHRELVAADYSAPTSRKRFVLVARCDGEPIRWPERTHAPAGSPEVNSGKCKPYRSAAEIIDWSIPAYSIFATKKEIKEKYGATAVRPLADNTLRRVIRGVDKFTIKSGRPFLVECNHSGGGHVSSGEDPLCTITQKFTGGICDPVLAPVTFPNTCNSVGSQASEPVYTITSAGNQVLASASLMSIGQTGGGDMIRSLMDPAPTTVSKQEACVVSANLIQYHTEKTESARADDLREPIHTIDSSIRYGLTAASLVEYYGNGNPLDLAEPMHTVTSHDREALVSCHIQKYFGGVVGEDATEPLPTITTIDHNAMCAAHITEFKGQDIGQNMDKPLRTITTSWGEFAQCRTIIAQYDGRNLHYWPEVRRLLNRYCGYDLHDDEVLLLVIGGIAYYIADITLRMLTPRELYNAMGFPADYVIDRDFMGNKYKKSAQVARCGNAVSPPMAEAVVRANLPEWCKQKITTMQELGEVVAG